MPEDRSRALAARFRPALEAEAAELETLMADAREAQAPVALDQQSVGRLSRMDALQGQAMAKASGERRKARRARIAAALARMEAGAYGSCAACDEEIPEARLAVDPTFPTCARCAGGG